MIMISAYFRENPLVGVLLAVLAIAVFAIWVLVLRARGEKNRENEDLIKKLKEENKLRNDFAILTPALAESSDEKDLFRGVSLGLQKKISDAPDMEGAFYGLTAPQRMIYAFSFVVEDGGEKLSGFFSANGKPLTDEAKNAAETAFSGEALEIFEKEFSASDPDDETTSYIPDEIKALDEKFAELVSTDEIMRLGGKYIKENLSAFI